MESLKRHRLNCAVRFTFKASYNVAEYEAFLDGLRLARKIQVKRLFISSDSQFVVSQVDSNFTSWYSGMAAYQKLVMDLLTNFKKFELGQILCLENFSKDSKLFRVISIEHLLNYQLQRGKVMWNDSIPSRIEPIINFFKE